MRKAHMHFRGPPQVMRAFCDEWEQKVGVKITLSHEDEPLGTAGPLALAKDILDDGSNEPFFVMNSDVICAYPLADMMAHHKRTNAEATLLVTKVRFMLAGTDRYDCRRGAAVTTVIIAPRSHVSTIHVAGPQQAM